MKLRTGVAAILMALLIVPAYLHAQQQTNTSADEAMTRLRLDIVLSEYDGSKEVDSLPYTLYLESALHGARTRAVRMGLKVPIATSASENGVSTQYQYEDVGTDIDARATPLSDGLYDLDLDVNRSSVYPANQSTDEKGIPRVGPVVRSFRSSFDLALRDGQTTQGPSATDPFNGHVLKTSVTLRVLK
jgi:hypothetical protein